MTYLSLPLTLDGSGDFYQQLRGAQAYFLDGSRMASRHVKMSNLAEINAGRIDEVLNDPPRSHMLQEGNTTFYHHNQG